MPNLTVEIAGRPWRVSTRGHDLSIPLHFDAPQPVFFGAQAASEQPLVAGSFTGQVERGASCNCSMFTLTPHCNGTHTECVGHITRERLSVRDAAGDHLSAAVLISIAPQAADSTADSCDPVPRSTDRLITRAALEAALAPYEPGQYQGLVVRTLPNDASRQHRNYDTGPSSAYFTTDAMRWIVQYGIRTLVVDLPSVDRSDANRLTAHRIFWGLPAGSTSAAAATRGDATITELAYIDDSIQDGQYLLNLQVAPFVADAAPSRPILLPLMP
jgi:kynurenine formamidase